MIYTAGPAAPLGTNPLLKVNGELNAHCYTNIGELMNRII